MYALQKRLYHYFSGPGKGPERGADQLGNSSRCCPHDEKYEFLRRRSNFSRGTDRSDQSFPEDMKVVPMPDMPWGDYGVMTAPCIEACPAHVNVPRYIDTLKRAVRITRPVWFFGTIR